MSERAQRDRAVADERRRDRFGLHEGVWPLLQAAEMQALDRETIEERGIPGELLMESAGRSLVEPTLSLRRASGRAPRPVRAFCGGGNNGGDGLVLVRHLHAEGVPAEAILVGDPERLPPDAEANWRRLAAVGAVRRVAEHEADWAALLDDSSVAVDALFGTGLGRPVEGRAAQVIEALRAARGRGLAVLAVDVPSGVAADTGQVLGVAVEADVTVTISLPKIGLALEPGRSLAGAVHVARVGIADPDPDRTPRVECWSPRAAAVRFPDRPPDGHKGRFGHVLVAAGSRGKAGAVALCARAVLRSGAGLVTVAIPGGIESGLAGLDSEAMAESLPTASGAYLDGESEKTLLGLAGERDVVALGPGLGRAPETAGLVRQLAATLDRPLVIDADGLFALGGALGGALGTLRDAAAPRVLTPHPGEAARLLDGDAATVNADRLAAARAIVEASGAVVVLKGAGTVVAEPGGRALVIPTGGPALATGGTGDVLTGVVAGLLAQGLPAFEAAGLAAWWHGAAADRAGRRGPGAGLLAHEVADALPAAWSALRRTGAGRGRGRGRGRADGKRGGRDEGLVLRFPGP